MQRNRRILLLLAMLLALFVVAACGGEEATPTPAPTEVPEEVVDEEAEEQVADDEEDVDEVDEEDVEDVDEEDVDEVDEEDVEDVDETDVEEVEEVEEETIVDVAGDFTTLLAALEAAELTETLQGDGPFTVFAPTDEAFEAALEELGISAEDLLADTETLTSILLYHVLDGAVFAETVVTLDGESVETLQGAEISISVTDDGVVLNDSVTVVTTDVEASNGVIHVIDGVLLPPAEEVEEVEEVDEVDEEEVEEVDEVDEEEVEEVDEPEVAAPQSLIATLRDDDRFSILLTALNRAALANPSLSVVLVGEGPLTVFAPTDEAFEAALEELGLTAEELLADTDTLQSVLLYHVLEGEVLAETVVTLDGESVATVQGAEISISVTDDGVVLNDSVNVIETDIVATNAVIHVIDGVLLP